MIRNAFGDFPSQESVPGYWWDHDLDHEYLRSVMPPTPWDERVLDRIGAHLVAEDSAAGSYESLAEMGDPQVRYLARMLAADEHRHHRMLVELMESVRRDSDCQETNLGTVSTIESDQRAALMGAVKDQIHIEKSDAGDLRQLRRELRSAPDGTLWPLIVEIMELDTEKHIRILKQIVRSLKHRHVERASSLHVE
jgi:rubrerythrin